METTSFDLHVLGTPPAFILSQDQTLIKKFMAYAGFLSLIFKVVSQTLKTDYPSKTEILIKEFSGLFCFLIVKDLCVSRMTVCLACDFAILSPQENNVKHFFKIFLKLFF